MQVQGQSLAFESPSAFSIYLKRLINPARKADDGWKTVKYGGKFLEHYKVVLARRRFPNGQAGGAHPDLVPEPGCITGLPNGQAGGVPRSLLQSPTLRHMVRLCGTDVQSHMYTLGP